MATFFPLTSSGVAESGHPLVASALPGDCRLYAPSWSPRHAAALAREVAIVRVPLFPRRWRSGRPLWARERFCRRREGALVAYSTDSAGRIVRGWFTQPADQAAYAAGGSGMRGPITCPIEAVWLETLQPGVPSLPAHLFIGAERDWPGYRAAVSRMESIHPGWFAAHQLGKLIA